MTVYHSGIISANIFINQSVLFMLAVVGKKFSHFKMLSEVTGEPKLLPNSFHYSL